MCTQGRATFGSSYARTVRTTRVSRVSLYNMILIADMYIGCSEKFVANFDKSDSRH